MAAFKNKKKKFKIKSKKYYSNKKKQLKIKNY